MVRSNLSIDYTYALAPTWSQRLNHIPLPQKLRKQLDLEAPRPTKRLIQVCGDRSREKTSRLKKVWRIAAYLCSQLCTMHLCTCVDFMPPFKAALCCCSCLSVGDLTICVPCAYTKNTHMWLRGAQGSLRGALRSERASTVFLLLLLFFKPLVVMDFFGIIH